MFDILIIWDEKDDREGNYWHICVEGHGLTCAEVEDEDWLSADRDAVADHIRVGYEQAQRGELIPGEEVVKRFCKMKEEESAPK